MEQTWSNSEGFGVIIPARYASTRLSGKPLREIGGKPMVVHVHEHALQSGADFVLVATDDERVARVVRDAGGEAVLTSSAHTNGTERLAEVAQHRLFSPEMIVVNLQCDEPLLEPGSVRNVAQALHGRAEAEIVTLATPIRQREDLFDPNVVKVVIDSAGLALYFSRAPIPWVRGAFGSEASSGQELPPGAQFFRHIGLYGHRVRTLLQVAEKPPAMLEQAEALEQLRALCLGVPIRVLVVPEPPGHGVDTDEDLERVGRVL